MLKREYRIKYNEVTLKYEQDGKPLTDRDFNSIFVAIKKVVSKASKDLVMSCIDSDITPVVNPVKDFFQRNRHESEGHIKALAETIDTPTGFRDDNFFPEYAYYFIRKWMIGAVAMWHKKHSPLMLVLAGAKQNTGKSHWFRYLLPDQLQPYYAESELTGDKDENLLMCNKILIMNDEMSNKSRKDITVMKQLCSKKWFNLRKPYGRLSEDFLRIAALAGTSNNIEILSDPTGNRRIIPIEVNAISHEKYNAIDKVALWMEAYKAFKDGEGYELTNEDIARLGQNTNEFEEASLERELVMKYFSKPDGSRAASAFTPSEIKAYIEVRTNQRLSLIKLGMELKKLGFEQRRVQIDGNVKRIYDVVASGEQVGRGVSVF
jgi:predicted P-loop ATPase